MSTWIVLPTPPAMPPVRICWACALPAYGLMLGSSLVLWLAVSVKLQPRRLPTPLRTRVLRPSSYPVLLMLPMFVVTADERLPAGAGILKIRRSVCLLYQSMVPLIRLSQRLKSAPRLVVFVSSHRMFGSTPVGRIVVTNSFPNCAVAAPSPNE